MLLFSEFQANRQYFLDYEIRLCYLYGRWQSIADSEHFTLVGNKEGTRLAALAWAHYKVLEAKAQACRYPVGIYSKETKTLFYLNRKARRDWRCPNGVLLDEVLDLTLEAEFRLVSLLSSTERFQASALLIDGSRVTLHVEKPSPLAGHFIVFQTED